MIAALRSWLAGFGHPTTTPMLPDPVTWTCRYPIDTDIEATCIRVACEEGWDSWSAIRVEPRFGIEPRWEVTYRRTDGAYRWRDDGFKGY